MSSDDKDQEMETFTRNDVNVEGDLIKDDSQAVDESSMDSESEDNEHKVNVKKDVNKEESDKEESEKEESEKEESDKEENKRRGSKKGESEKVKNKKAESEKEESEKGESDDEKETSSAHKKSNKEDSEKEESENEDDEKEESEKESEEDEKKEMGLLDRPVEVSGCRARKKVERFEMSFSTPKEKQKEIPEGRGQKLGECPRIEFQISKHSVADLKPLHRILYSKMGSVHNTKKNIRKFSGYPFDEDSHEWDQKKINMEKFNTSILRGVCEVLDLERGGTKEDIINRIMTFLLKPLDSGKDPRPKPKKKSLSRDKKKSVKKTKITKIADESEEEADKVESNETMKSKDGTKGKKTPKAKGIKKEKPKKEVAKGAKRKRDVLSDSSDDDDDEPIARKAAEPSEREIKKLVTRILDGADLEEITMKKVIKQVYDTYPNCDLSHKKSFIKLTIRMILSS